MYSNEITKPKQHPVQSYKKGPTQTQSTSSHRSPIEISAHHLQQSRNHVQDVLALPVFQNFLNRRHSRTRRPQEQNDCEIAAGKSVGIDCRRRSSGLTVAVVPDRLRSSAQDLLPSDRLPRCIVPDRRLHQVIYRRTLRIAIHKAQRTRGYYSC